ncbi:MAG: DUF6249 domain-containing protein [Hyphomonadaceae bacterium]|nr:DUF6249 domain-containing protein [Hyphomonadaceae bacterium]
MDASAIYAISLPILFVCIAVTIIVPIYLHMRHRAQPYGLLKHALDKGQTLPPETVEALTRRVLPTPERDLRRAVLLFGVTGVILLLGLAFFLMGLSAGRNDDDYRETGLYTMIFAIIPGGLGATYFVLSKLKRPPPDA